MRTGTNSPASTENPLEATRKRRQAEFRRLKEEQELQIAPFPPQAQYLADQRRSYQGSLETLCNQLGAIDMDVEIDVGPLCLKLQRLGAGNIPKILLISSRGLDTIQKVECTPIHSTDFYWAFLHNRLKIRLADQCSLKNDPVRALLLLGEFGDAADLMLHWGALNAAFIEQKVEAVVIEQALNTLQKTVMMRGHFDFADYLFEELQLIPPVDIVISATHANNKELLEMLWSRFPEKREAYFSLLDFYSLCLEGRDQVLRFLKKRKNDFAEAGITIDTMADFGRPIAWALRSAHERSCAVLQELLESGFEAEADDVFLANTLEKFNVMIGLFAPTSQTLLRVIDLDAQRTPLSRAKVIALMDSGLRISCEEFKGWVNLKGSHHLRTKQIFLEYINEFRDTKLAQNFLYQCIIFKPGLLTVISEGDLEDYIVAHREAIIYRPFVEDLVRKTEDPDNTDACLTALHHLKAFYEKTEFEKAHELLFSGRRNPFKDRLGAHVYLIFFMARDAANFDSLRRDMRGFSCEKIYAALTERVGLIENIEFKVKWLALALNSGVFTEDLCRKITGDIYEIKGPPSPTLFRAVEAVPARLVAATPADEQPLPETLKNWDVSEEDDDETELGNPFMPKKELQIRPRIETQTLVLPYGFF